MGVTLAPGISHRPGSSSENIIQPVVDATGLILRPFSNGQSSPVFQVQNVDGTDVHFGLNADGEIELSGGIGSSGQVLTSGGVGNPVAWTTPSGGDLSTAVILAPNSVDRNLVIAGGDDQHALVLQAHSATTTAAILHIRDGLGNQVVKFDQDGSFISTPHPGTGLTFVVSDPNHPVDSLAVQESGNGTAVFCASSDPGDVALDAIANFDFNGGQTADIFRVVASNFSKPFKVSASGAAIFGNALRVEGGATPQLGAFGAPPVGQQLLATGAGHTVDDVITVLQTFGFCKQS